VTYWAGVGFGAGEVLELDLCDLWCFLVCVVGVVDIEAPDFELVLEEVLDEDDVDVDVDGVGFGAVEDCCAATAIGRPNASARLTSFFMTVSPVFAMPFAS
jgi:hypothetical protein